MLKKRAGSVSDGMSVAYASGSFFRRQRRYALRASLALTGIVRLV